MVVAGLGWSCLAAAQTNEYNLTLKVVQDEQKEFRQFIAHQTFDENIRNVLEKFNNYDINNLQVDIRKMMELDQREKMKAIRCIGYFLKELRSQLQKDQLNVYKVPALLEAFKEMLPAFVTKIKIDRYLDNLDWRSTQVLANTFWQFDSKKNIEDISTYRRLLKTPEFILPFLEKNPHHGLRDSLILYYATHFPDDLILYLKKKQNGLADIITQHPDIYIRQISNLSGNLNATELVPFTEQLVQNKITVDTILGKRKKVNEYFQLLVNTILKNREQLQPSSFQKALYHALYEKSIDFYAKEINALHASPDQMRFASVKTLRPVDLYYIIVMCDNELYTSTYLGLYKRLMEYFKDRPADSLFTLVKNDQFRKFIRIAAGYNTLDDFLKHMSPDSRKKVMHDFIAGISNDADEEDALQDAVEVADAFPSFAQDPELNEFVQYELSSNLDKCRNENAYQCVRLYSILNNLYKGLNNQATSFIATALEHYQQLPVNALKNARGEVIELVLFYGDDDGKASFQSFSNLFKDSSQWQITKNENWIEIRSKQEFPLIIFANLPLSNEDEKDLEAMVALTNYLKTQSLEPTILIHRGHSYHLKNTLKQLSPFTKLAILGSCGGYNNVQKIITANPDMQIIASRQVGSMSVNDPMLSVINTSLAEGKDLIWSTAWSDLDEKFKKSPEASKLFSEYVPPFKNISLFVYKLYYYEPQNTVSSEVPPR
jgi:hypothetical protein